MWTQVSLTAAPYCLFSVQHPIKVPTNAFPNGVLEYLDHIIYLCTCNIYLSAYLFNKCFLNALNEWMNFNPSFDGIPQTGLRSSPWGILVSLLMLKVLLEVNASLHRAPGSFMVPSSFLAVWPRPSVVWGLSRWHSGTESACQWRRCKRGRVQFLGWEDPL